MKGLTSDLKVDLPPQPQTSLSNYKQEKEPTPGAGAFEVLGWVGGWRSHTLTWLLSLCIIHSYHWTLLFLILWRKEPSRVRNTGRNKYMKSIRIKHFLKVLYNQSLTETACYWWKNIPSAGTALKQLLWAGKHECFGPWLWPELLGSSSVFVCLFILIPKYCQFVSSIASPFQLPAF